MKLTWKRTLRTPSSERFLALRDGKDLAAVERLHKLNVGITPLEEGAPHEKHHKPFDFFLSKIRIS
jgi:hypothetical protein